jgi:hypothetical protein
LRAFRARSAWNGGVWAGNPPLSAAAAHRATVDASLPWSPL